eukprot:3940548-Rhodomonas_salina.1
MIQTLVASNHHQVPGVTRHEDPVACMIDLMSSSIVDLSNHIGRGVGYPSTDVNPDGAIVRGTWPRCIHSK